MKLYHGSDKMVSPNLQLCFKNNRVIKNVLFYSGSVTL